MKIATINIRYECEEEQSENNFCNRLNRIKKLLERVDADLFGFQEVTLKMLEQLVDLLPSYDYVYRSRDDISDEGTPIFYKKEKFDLLEKESFFLNKHPNKPGRSWGSGCPRVCSFVLLKEKNTDKVYAYFNTHLDHWSEEARANSINLIIKKAKKYMDNIILSGDFNVYEKEPTYNYASEYLNDSKHVADTKHTGNTFHGFDKIAFDENASPIDYVFVSKKMHVKNYEILNYKIDNYNYSDHYGIVVEIE